MQVIRLRHPIIRLKIDHWYDTKYSCMHIHASYQCTDVLPSHLSLSLPLSPSLSLSLILILILSLSLSLSDFLTK